MFLLFDRIELAWYFNAIQGMTINAVASEKDDEDNCFKFWLWLSIRERN